MVLGSSRRRRGGTRIAAWAAAAVLTLGMAVTGCGDDGQDGTEPLPETSVERTEQAPDEGPEDEAAAEREVKENWERFFDAEVPLNEKEAVLENGADMRPVLQAFNSDPRGKQVGASVSDVEFTSRTEADVTYTLSLDGQPALRDATGVAVEQGGTWKVSVKTLCALVQMNSGNASPVPGC
ncbi:hypothetical protein QIS99_21955 [Streptomyces sp. B-S-A8]|uniref:Low molecular weight antigen MTB12-like C-terminal domain-containing protein n=1 Tax=Streptomyces solicavernae TaxID=3043614 RepID=A0ABT6RWL7_9ACTN|nr:hypothetical protein [Streptomyces sp. B-S-A8]MDI3388836.1 hypothetical protein [Streptomyces sp. B-S-A8]